MKSRIIVSSVLLVVCSTSHAGFSLRGWFNRSRGQTETRPTETTLRDKTRIQDTMAQRGLQDMTPDQANELKLKAIVKGHDIYNMSEIAKELVGKPEYANYSVDQIVAQLRAQGEYQNLPEVQATKFMSTPRMKPVDKMTPEQYNDLLQLMIEGGGRADSLFNRLQYKAEQQADGTYKFQQNIRQPGEALHPNVNYAMNKVNAFYVDAVINGQKSGQSREQIASAIHDAWTKNDAWRVDGILKARGLDVYKMDPSEIYRAVETIEREVAAGAPLQGISAADLAMFRSFDRLPPSEQVKDLDKIDTIVQLAQGQ